MGNKIHLFLSLFIGFFILSENAIGQVTIGSGNSPNADALLDLKQEEGKASTKGLLLPRVELVQTGLSYPMKAHVKGMFVYNTMKRFDVSPGCYYNTGVEWVRIDPETNIDIQETVLNTLWTAQSGWVIESQEFNGYGKKADFILKVKRSGSNIQSWNSLNAPLLIAKIATASDKKYKPFLKNISNQNGLKINILVHFPERTISTVADGFIDLDGSIYLLNVRESVGTIMNRGTIKYGDMIVISGDYSINP